MATDITTQILIEIRDQIIATRTDLTAELQAVKTELKAEIAKTNVRLDATNEKLESLEAKVDAIGRYAKNISRRHEKAIDELRERVAKLEARRKN